jgi:hypothetical protein
MPARHKPLAGLLYILALVGLATASCSSEVHPATQDRDAAFEAARTDAVTGPCLLLYNSSQVDGLTDGCCYYMGGVNTCNTAMTCSVSSGPQCCLLYASDATTGGDGCCLYEGGRTPYTANGMDRTAECAALISSGR